MKTLIAKGLKKTFKSRHVVKGISIEVKQGDVVGLLGPNGAGKTTSFYMIIGIIRPDAGQIIFDNHDITHMAMDRRARIGIGYLPQERSIFRKLTVEQNLLAVMELVKMAKVEKQARLEELLNELGIAHIRQLKGYALSGGESRRAEIARSLVIDPSFILLDEPFAGVDPIAVLDIQKIIRHLKEKNIGVLLTDHNVRETFGIIDRGYIMNEGRLMAQGTPEELMQNEQARKVYLGDLFSI